MIEVADTTLAYDLGTKVPLYQRHGIPEIWMVDLQGRQIHLFRKLGAASEYGPARIVRPSEHVSACGVPVDAGSLFP